MNKRIYKNNSNGNIYILIEELQDETNTRVDKWVVIYMNAKTRKKHARERDEFYRKFSKIRSDLK